MHKDQMKGGVWAHVFRRLFHVVTLIGAPIIYYFFLLPDVTHRLLVWILLSIAIVIIIFECLRIRYQLVIFGQRKNELSRVSAFTWTSISLLFLFWLSPSASITLPICITCALADPLLGELRSKQAPELLTMLLVMLLSVYIWHQFISVAWVAILMGIITVLVEKPNFSWVDDNALMLLVPFTLMMLFLQLGLLG